MKSLIFLTLAVALVTIAVAQDDPPEPPIEPAPPEAVAEAKGSDPDVAAIADQPGDPVVPQEETHLAPAEAAEVPPAEAARIEAEDKKDVAVEDKEVKEEKAEEVVEKKDEVEAKKEEADPKIPPPVKEEHKKIRAVHHKNFKHHHADRVRELMRRVIDRIFRHETARHHKKG